MNHICLIPSLCTSIISQKKSTFIFTALINSKPLISVCQPYQRNSLRYFFVNIRTPSNCEWLKVNYVGACAYLAVTSPLPGDRQGDYTWDGLHHRIQESRGCTQKQKLHGEEYPVTWHGEWEVPFDKKSSPSWVAHIPKTF